MGPADGFAFEQHSPERIDLHKGVEPLVVSDQAINRNLMRDALSFQEFDEQAVANLHTKHLG